jgi:hypothetical protein
MPGQDGGVTTGLAVGSACSTGPQCTSNFCLPENSPLGATGFPGGYCSQNCGNGTTCPMGSTCISSNALGVPTTTCFATCDLSALGTQGPCRTGYVCSPSPMSSTPTAFCAPKCTNGGLAGCGNGQTCNMTTGLCQ